MSSKRQQARNERILQDLVKTVPGNSVCADCQARNPGWASWSLGIFLCMRCAALHRKLGTHITKVKSLSMDAWSNDQVENMKRVGNTASNKIYNPSNTRPPIPIDADEADSAMERFIRQKYQEAASSRAQILARHHTGSTTSDDHPPPLPPKTGTRFGFRSASSIFPLSSKASKARREADATASLEARESHFDRSPSPPRNKPSRIFGTAVGSEVPDDLDTKLARLRDMGFRDETRNTAILKGLGGNLEKTIETLVRLGGVGGGVVSIGKSANNSESSPRARSPLTLGAGLSINRTKDTKSPPRSARSAASSNPFDMLDAMPAQPQSSQSTGALGPQSQQNPYPPAASSNPFGVMPSQSQYGLNQAFQNMSIQSTQPLFPNHTGGFPAQQQQSQPFQQTMTPPVPSIPQQYHPPVIYENQAQQSGQQNYNPFMQQMQQQQPQQQQQAPSLNTNFQSNPYAAQLQSPAAQFYQSPITQSPQVQQQNQGGYYDTGYQQSPQPLQHQQNPFFQNTQQAQAQAPAPQQGYGYQQAQQPQQQPQQPQQQAQYDQFRQQTYPGMAQQTLRPDKRSIMDLYNYPQLAPTPPQQPDQSQQQTQQQAFNAPTAVATQPQQQQQQQQANAFSNTLATHMAGSRNPFGGGMNGVGGAPAQNGSEQPMGGGVNPFPPKNTRHVSQESISVDSGGWMNGNGRHSPDAFAGLSARSLR